MAHIAHIPYILYNHGMEFSCFESCSNCISGRVKIRCINSKETSIKLHYMLQIIQIKNKLKTNKNNILHSVFGTFKGFLEKCSKRQNVPFIF